MPLDIATAGLQLGGETAQAGMGIAFNALTHKMNVRHQQDYTNQQVQAQKQMGLFNKEQALDTWNKTNAEAQMKHLKNAGLNPGLMYGNSGAGGATTNAGGSGNVTAGHNNPAQQNAGMGLQMASQLALMKAQKENIEADTANKKAESTFTGGAKTASTEAGTALAGATKAKTEAETTNVQQQTKLAEYNTQIAKIASEIKTEGKSLEIGTLNAIWNKLQADTEVSKQAKIESEARIVNLSAHNALISSNITKNEAEINEIANAIQQKWQEIAYEGMKIGLSSQELGTKIKQVAINEAMARFHTSDPKVIQQWADLFLSGIGMMSGNARAAAAFVP